MKKFLLAISIFSAVSMSAQTTLPSFGESSEGLEMQGVSFGYFDFGSSGLNSYLDQFGRTASFSDNYMAIGIDNLNSSGRFQTASSLQFLLPQEAAAGPNDSLRLRMGGWHIMTSLIAYDFIPSEAVNFVIGTSIDWGNLRMKRTVGGQTKRYTNPFVAPGGRADLQFKIGPVVIGARAAYRYDITKTLWKRKSPNLEVLPAYRNSGMGYYGFIGLSF